LANLIVVARGKIQLSMMDSNTAIVTGNNLLFFALLACKVLRYIVVAFGSAKIQATASMKPSCHYSLVVQTFVSMAVSSDLETLGFR